MSSRPQHDVLTTRPSKHSLRSWFLFMKVNLRKQILMNRLSQGSTIWRKDLKRVLSMCGVLYNPSDTDDRNTWCNVCKQRTLHYTREHCLTSIVKIITSSSHSLRGCLHDTGATFTPGRVHSGSLS